MAERCNYGSLKDELIRDRLVVGLRDIKLGEKLQLDAELTLEKEITLLAIQSVKLQHKEIRSIEQSALDVGEVRGQANTKTLRNEEKVPFRSNPQRKGKSGDERCQSCGGVRGHTKTQCSAVNKRCIHCGKKATTPMCAC